MLPDQTIRPTLFEAPTEENHAIHVTVLEAHTNPSDPWPLESLNPLSDRTRKTLDDYPGSGRGKLLQ